MPLATFLNADYPTRLRGLAFLALSDTGILLARTSTTDAGGGATSAWTTTGTVPCRVDPIGDRGASGITGGRIDERSTHVVTTPAGAAVSSDGRILVSGRGTFEVTAVQERTAELLRMFEAVKV